MAQQPPGATRKDTPVSIACPRRITLTFSRFMACAFKSTARKNPTARNHYQSRPLSPREGACQCSGGTVCGKDRPLCCFDRRATIGSTFAARIERLAAEPSFSHRKSHWLRLSSRRRDNHVTEAPAGHTLRPPRSPVQPIADLLYRLIPAGANSNLHPTICRRDCIRILTCLFSSWRMLLITLMFSRPRANSVKDV
jgi:hypothetical protein